jgi:hypothetical protein
MIWLAIKTLLVKETFLFPQFIDFDFRNNIILSKLTSMGRW